MRPTAFLGALTGVDVPARIERIRPFGRPPRRIGKPLTAKQILRATGATRADMERVRASLRAADFGWAVARPCATCGDRDPAHALAWVSTGEGTRHGYHYNDRDRPAGRSLHAYPVACQSAQPACRVPPTVADCHGGGNATWKNLCFSGWLTRHPHCHSTGKAWKNPGPGAAQRSPCSSEYGSAL